MALIIPSNYHKISDVEKNHISWIEPELAKRQDIRPLRIGILNIMPLGKQYEFNLLHPLGLSPLQIEPVWIKLKTHSYKTWDLNHLNNLYITWEEANNPEPLDGIIITGAPIEHLAFEDVKYWDEFVKIVNEARNSCASTLGLCWAGFALAYLAGVDKQVFDRKLFGVFPLKSLVPGHPLMGTQDDEFICPQSRFAGLPDLEMEKAQKDGKLNLLGIKTQKKCFASVHASSQAWQGKMAWSPLYLMRASSSALQWAGLWLLGPSRPHSWSRF